jgi:voltage-gated potassium channel
VALVVLPFLRPLRLLRLLAFARVLNRSVAGSLVGRVSTYVLGVAIVAVGLGALAVLDSEQNARGANITNYGDALWWACTTVTTVGYGDHFPITTEGRLVAVALMIVGIAMVGAVTASVAAWMIGQVERERSREVARTPDRE